MAPASGYETLSAGMAQVSHYFDWIYGEMELSLGDCILEIGPGFGNLAERILRSGRQYFALDSDPGVIQGLQQRLNLAGDHCWVGDVADRLTREHLSSLNKINTVISMNVLEHIERDRDHLQAIARLLPRFRLILFVPALPLLYGTLDAQAGHYRRYTRQGLTRLLLDAGAKNIRVRYFNTLGIFGWFLAGRILRCRLQSEGTNDSIVWYDRYVIPLARWIERWIGGHIGQSLLVIAEGGTHAGV